MRILITVPHYYNPHAGSAYGSGKEERQERAARIKRSILSLREQFVLPKAWIQVEVDEEKNYRGHLYKPADAEFLSQIDLVVCTDGQHHLLDELTEEKDCFLHQPINIDDPRYLGFGCHQVLLRNKGKYDYYCYMEDDLIIRDSYFFQKLRWFERKFGSQNLLQPHRYNANENPFARDYLDFEFYEFNEKNRSDDLTVEFLGKPLTFVHSTNPHAACFFLSAAQYELMAAREDYARPSDKFVGPLESAASLDILKTFRIYRADYRAAQFLAIEHIGTRPYRRRESRLDKSAFANLGFNVP